VPVLWTIVEYLAGKESGLLAISPRNTRNIFLTPPLRFDCLCLSR